ncbi:hypothetical protein K6119_12620 [Paracrocinitomix mangrovi]|uniref:hypothetical protein n=1 Tax=Paracrocinitomix mangrovi TaxID=2862509 RepID=UPI001C8E2B50|nr:hypothetical protein [Paracrocinitomix mangrovi]UKN00574.1 hypothetical protein K6119_12620 [Paracrocinitomix mangrovi]
MLLNRYYFPLMLFLFSFCFHAKANDISYPKHSIRKISRIDYKEKSLKDRISPFRPIKHKTKYEGVSLGLIAFGLVAILIGVFFIVDYAKDQFFENLGIIIGPILILIGVGLIILGLK